MSTLMIGASEGGKTKGCTLGCPDQRTEQNEWRPCRSETGDGRVATVVANNVWRTMEKGKSNGASNIKRHAHLNGSYDTIVKISILIMSRFSSSEIKVLFLRIIHSI
ncbi:hypothetical protein BT93_L0749 [Corymbia citriodora subsp. variegata]|uniref:Uncharacterized protein n=1 Tax=Corymbia citriodora subsp. variegata TaxID=360336 RepID=A0A8T0CQL4_CORYI|nr:hypothetical protein BT93_L0749 [Corymbia citriodora subsp. variegata]